jgi:ribose 5-phosphate isomerase B
MIAIGNDHAGTVLKSYVTKFFDENKIDYIDCGCAEGERCDYPNKAAEVCEMINSKKAKLGILICGTGVGMSISANKIKGIRAAAVSDYFSAKYTRLHNDANVL